MRRASWYGWKRDENGKTDQVQTREQVQAHEMAYEYYKKASLELGELYPKLSEKEMIGAQENLAGKIDLTNRFKLSDINLIAGVDLIYMKDKDGNERALCDIEVMDIRTKEIVDNSRGFCIDPAPYRPGFLAFREFPAVLSAYSSLWIKPDIFMFDGNGYLHERHMGLATHASIMLGVPAIGVAKSYSKIHGVDYKMPENEVGAYTDIVIHGEVCGRVLRTRRDVKPIFVSCGNWIDLDTATKITLSMVTTESRLPLPTCMADIGVRNLRKILLRDQEKDAAE